MQDIFENTILCKHCNKKMQPAQLAKKGFILRALKCDPCKNLIVHPEDLKEYENFQNIKKKQFKVKLRYIGNSYAVSIPREIIAAVGPAIAPLSFQERKLTLTSNVPLPFFNPSPPFRLACFPDPLEFPQ